MMFTLVILGLHRLWQVHSIRSIPPMAHSTTTTATRMLTLTKYSRSYPPLNSVHDQPESQLPDIGWQHFVNPVIRVVLEVRKSSKGDVESFKLRIVWRMASGNGSMAVDQSEVIFVRWLSHVLFSNRMTRRNH
jgi:hypothetical protein